MQRRRVFRLLYFLPLSILVLLPWIDLVPFLFDPSCGLPISSLTGEYRSDDAQLRVMVVGDLHLGGPSTMWLDRVRRDGFMKASFKKAFRALKPHALLVLGDISDWGRKSTKEQWHSVVLRFQEMLKPFWGLPVHVLPGNHDIGDYNQITSSLTSQFVDAFPGLDGTGSEVFMIRNISFVSLNSMALACEECSTYSEMREVVERSKVALQKVSTGMHSSLGHTQHTNLPAHTSGHALNRPVLLTHLPLYRIAESVCDSVDIPICAPWHEVEGECKQLFESPKLYHKPINYRSKIDMLYWNTSMFLLSAFKPRLVLSAHAHRFCSRMLDAGVREITVSTFTWRNRDDPSFLLAHFYKDGSFDIQQCFLPRESFVLGMHVAQGVTVFLLIVLGGLHYRKMQKRARLHLKT